MNHCSKAQTLVVVHHQDDAQCLRNAKLAFDCGAQGVMLIQMQGLDDALEHCAAQLKLMWPERWIGVNFLSLGPLEALKKSLRLGLDGTWSDKPGVSSEVVSAQAIAIAQLLRQNPGHQFFGSVAFKYQATEPSPGVAALKALALRMIPTTSGPATGHAPSLQKILDIRALTKGAPLALASGLTPQNVAEFSPHLTHLLVATGVSDSFHELSEHKLKEFLRNVS